MFWMLALTLMSSTHAARDTTVVLGRVERDLTGDGRPEVLSLIGVGRTIDSLTLTFSIEQPGRTLYRAAVKIPDRRTFEKEIRESLRMEYAEWLRDVGVSFFTNAHFKSPTDFVTTMRESLPEHIQEIPFVIAHDGGFPQDSARAVWSEIQKARLTVFEFSRGGDDATAIVWSPTNHRFYHLLSCC